MDSDADIGIAALRAIDRLLLDQPDKVGHDFSAAEHAIAAYRDVLTKNWRATRLEVDRQRLAQVNAVLSVVVGGHFPLGGVPWPYIHKARDCLAVLVG
jgi:formate dehydrogenase major subunit